MTTSLCPSSDAMMDRRGTTNGAWKTTSSCVGLVSGPGSGEVAAFPWMGADWLLNGLSFGKHGASVREVLAFVLRGWNGDRGTQICLAFSGSEGTKG